MKLLTKEIRERLPQLRDTQHQTDPVAQVKFLAPWSNWTWYGIEFDGYDLFFGLVNGFDCELGYFILSELEAARGPGGVRIERDIYFDPTPISQLKGK